VYWSVRLCAWKICEITVHILEKHEKFDMGIFIHIYSIAIVKRALLTRNPQPSTGRSPQSQPLSGFLPQAAALFVASVVQ
jgi:hypothetical protein